MKLQSLFLQTTKNKDRAVIAWKQKNSYPEKQSAVCRICGMPLFLSQA